jgi:hypothetical protein
MPETPEPKQGPEGRKPTELPLLVRITRADRQKVATVLSR